MGDLISRRKLDGMRLAVPDFLNPDARTKGWNECITYIQQNAPAVDAEPVRRGEWRHLGGDEWCCNWCGDVIHTEGSWEKPTKKYCSECGAKMKEEEESDRKRKA